MYNKKSRPASWYQQKTNTMYTLQVRETGKKSGKYHYQVKDAQGNVISERKSNREYVACTINGSHYFGRLDLIGKGDHGKSLRFWAVKGIPATPIAYRNGI